MTFPVLLCLLPFPAPSLVLLSPGWGNQMAHSSLSVIDSDSGATLVSALFSVATTPHHKPSIFSQRGICSSTKDQEGARKYKPANQWLLWRYHWLWTKTSTLCLRSPFSPSPTCKLWATSMAGRQEGEEKQCKRKDFWLSKPARVGWS